MQQRTNVLSSVKLLSSLIVDLLAESLTKTMGASFMSRTVAQGFDELRSRLEITDLQASTVSTRQQNVRDAVKKELVALDDFLTGSYMRNTMIAPLSDADIDIFFVL